MNWFGVRRLHYSEGVRRTTLRSQTFMRRKAVPVRWPSGLGPFPQSVRERFEEILELYDYLAPSWCRRVSVEVDDPYRGPRGAAAVTARCISSRGEMVFTLPPDWFRLSAGDQELSVVFWFALDDLSRGLTSTVGSVVDAVRQEADGAEPPSEPASDLYHTVLPIIGSSALGLAKEAVGGGRGMHA